MQCCNAAVALKAPSRSVSSPVYSLVFRCSVSAQSRPARQKQHWLHFVWYGIPPKLKQPTEFLQSAAWHHFYYFAESLKNFLTTFALSLLYRILMFFSSTKNHFINFLTILIIWCRLLHNFHDFFANWSFLFLHLYIICKKSRIIHTVLSSFDNLLTRII